MATNAMSAAQLTNWLPTYQSAKALADLESELVIAKTVWLEWRDQLPWGNAVKIPIVPNLGTADAVAYTADLTLNAQTAKQKTITVDQYNYKAVGVGYKEQLQNRPDYLTNIASKCVYACSEAVDVYLGSLFNTLTAGNVGTQGLALEDDTLLAAVENLAAAKASRRDRAMVLDPESITDLFMIDKMVRDDYVVRGAVESSDGMIGRSRYGCMVYQSVNCPVKNTSYHAAAMYQREAIGCIIQKKEIVDYFDWKEKFTNVVRAQVLFGATVLRPTCGVCINTRS